LRVFVHVVNDNGVEDLKSGHLRLLASYLFLKAVE
jgi:hypothetical protein